MNTEEQIVNRLLNIQKKIVLAESCTGGQLAARLSAVPGVSAVLWGSYVCYTAEAKQAMLHIPAEYLSQYGLVSSQTVSAMAESALDLSGADIAVAVSGLLGPEGDGSAVPVGDVWIAMKSVGQETKTYLNHYNETRILNRDKLTEDALNLVLGTIT